MMHAQGVLSTRVVRQLCSVIYACMAGHFSGKRRRVNTIISSGNRGLAGAVAAAGGRRRGRTIRQVMRSWSYRRLWIDSAARYCSRNLRLNIYQLSRDIAKRPTDTVYLPGYRYLHFLTNYAKHRNGLNLTVLVTSHGFCCQSIIVIVQFDDGKEDRPWLNSPVMGIAK